MSDNTLSTDKQKGIIAWFAKNSVAANLLMLVILTVGTYAALNIQRTVFPDINPEIITITMAYPGAAPAEVEKGVVLKIEEALKDIESIKQVTATSRESVANLSLELHNGYEVTTVLDEVNNAVNAISNFPEQAEKPIINQVQIRHHALSISIYGNLNELAMKQLAEQVKEELLQDPKIAYAEINGARDYEITIEVPEATLRKYQLTLDQVARAIRNSSIDLPGGSIKTITGDILLRTKGQAYNQQDFEQVVLITYPDGTRLTLGDIATINDGFVEDESFSLFNQKPSVMVTVFAVGEQDLIEVAEAAKTYINTKREQLPEGVSIDHWADITFYLQGRLDMMISNLTLGAILVLIVLGLFLDVKLAFWVMAGLPVCFLGTFAVMGSSMVDVSINMISLFGFILVLGIVVDDAIIIGESAYRTIEEKGHSTNSVVEGALRVATPATFGVLTTIIAFMPTLFASGFFAPMPEALGVVVILCLIFSLIESKWILPAHLVHSKPADHGFWKKANSVQAVINRKLQTFIRVYYQPFLEKCIHYRYNTFAIFVAALIIIGGMVAGGVVRYVMLPDVAGDFVHAELEMVEGSAEWETREAHRRVSDAIYQVNRQYMLETNSDTGFIKHLFSWESSRLNAQFMMELTKNETRNINSDEIVNRWRQQVGTIAGAKSVSFTNADGPGSGAAIGFRLMSSDPDVLAMASDELVEKLATYDGVFDIKSSASTVQDEIILSIKPAAEALGLSLADLGNQVRQAFYGAEAQRIQRGNSEVKVMVRYPEHDRKTLADLENMYIRTNQGDEIPFSSVADIAIEPGLRKSQRINGQQSISITSQANKALVEPGQIVSDIEQNFIPELKRKYPGLRSGLDGESSETGELARSLALGFVLSLFGIYALLAIPLKSYMQPLIIMGVIPFGIIGAIIGHIIVGIAFDMMSFFGVIALSGVVVNDSLIMVDYVNKAVARGEEKLNAILEAGQVRFRAILLTSLTTFFGLLPMLLETSMQAQIMIPMAVSLGFGIVFATVITLILIPCLYVVLDDLKKLFGSVEKKVSIEAS